MNLVRPKNLNLFTIKFPIPAIVSILHRISGAILCLLIPFLLWGLSLSFTPAGFEMLQEWSASWYVKLLAWLIFMPFCFHFVAGIRHLLMDIHIGQSLKAGRFAAFLTCLITLFLVILSGIWIW